MNFCTGCGSQDLFVEYLNENQTGRGCFVTEITHCRNCQSNFPVLKRRGV